MSSDGYQIASCQRNQLKRGPSDQQEKMRLNSSKNRLLWPLESLALNYKYNCVS